MTITVDPDPRPATPPQWEVERDWDLARSEDLDRARAQERADYIAGVRALADILDAHPDLPIPDAGDSSYSPIRWYVQDKATLALFARAIPGGVEKSGDSKWFNLTAKLHGVHVEAFADRPTVCERVVTGTETVTTKVKDPAALALVPEIEVTETVETVEWRCTPLLASVPS